MRFEPTNNVAGLQSSATLMLPYRRNKFQENYLNILRNRQFPAESIDILFNWIKSRKSLITNEIWTH